MSKEKKVQTESPKESVVSVATESQVAEKIDAIKKISEEHQKPKIVDEANTKIKDDADAIVDKVEANQDIEKVVEDNPEPEKQETEEDYIPDSFVEAGRELGMTDDEIREFAEKNPKVLEALAAKTAIREPGEKPAEEQSAATVDPKIFEPVALELDENEWDEKIVKVMKSLVDGHNETKKVLKAIYDQNVQHEQTRMKSAQAAVLGKFNGVLDDLSKEIPQLGQTGKIAKGTPQWQARESIWNMAVVLQKGNPSLSDDAAIDDAVQWYKGKIGAKVATDSIVKQLNDRAKKITYKPTNRNKTVSYKNEQDAALAKIRETKERLRA